MAYNSNFSADDFIKALDVIDSNDIGSLVFEKAFEYVKLTDFFPLMTGVSFGKKIPYLAASEDYSGFPFIDSTSCTVPACDISDEYSTKTYEGATIGCSTELCLNSLDSTFKRFWNSKCKDTDDLANVIFLYFVSKLEEQHGRAFLRTILFGDKSSDDVLFNGIDGLYTQADTIINAAEAKAKQYVPIAENVVANNATYALQMALQEETAFKTFEAMRKLHRVSKWATENAALIVTPALYYNYVDYLRAKGSACCERFEEIARNGFNEPLSFDKYKIIVLDDATKIMQQFDQFYTDPQDKSAAMIAPHRALLMPLENFAVYTQCENSFEQERFWHSPDKNTLNFSLVSEFGGKILDSEKVIYAK